MLFGVRRATAQAAKRVSVENARRPPGVLPSVDIRRGWVSGCEGESGSEKPTCVFCDLAKRNQQTGRRTSWVGVPVRPTHGPNVEKGWKTKMRPSWLWYAERVLCVRAMLVACVTGAKWRRAEVRAKERRRRREAQQPRFQRYSSQTFDASLVHAAAKIYAAGGKRQLGNKCEHRSFFGGRFFTVGPGLNETFSI